MASSIKLLLYWPITFCLLLRRCKNSGIMRWFGARFPRPGRGRPAPTFQYLIATAILSCQGRTLPFQTSSFWKAFIVG